MAHRYRRNRYARHQPFETITQQCLACVQDLFYEDDSVLYIDMHQQEVWPGSGHANEIGHGKGLGTTINVPMPGVRPSVAKVELNPGEGVSEL